MVHYAAFIKGVVTFCESQSLQLVISLKLTTMRGTSLQCS